MCGITAIIRIDRGSPSTRSERTTLIRQLKQSLDRIEHRGPDSRGTWISKDERIAFGHVRLSIKDLSDAGTQPLSNQEGTVHAVVNGEFYEYDGFRAQLSTTYNFQSQSDSELLIALYKRDGLNCFSYLRGEFSFVLYDSQREILLAATDRFGIKPLFWTVVDGRLLIASEAKAFVPLGWKPEWDVRSVVEDGWLHDERTLFRGVRKIMPGHYMTCYSFDSIHHRPYWETTYPNKNVKDPRTEQEMISQLREELYQSVSLRVQGDVPVGVYLSGGLDSAIIAGILADVLRTKNGHIRHGMAQTSFSCFSVGFEENTEFDEMPLAQHTAEHVGAKFIAQRLDESILAENFEATTWACEHHNPDLNSVAKFLLSKLVADNGVKVVLSGEGSDEHFAGYSQFMPDAIREPDLTTKDHNRMSARRREELTDEIESRTMPGYKGVPQTFAQSHSDVARRMLNNSYISASLWTVTIAPFAPWTAQMGHMSVEETRAISAGARSLERINNEWHPLHTAEYIWTRSILPNLILTSMGDRMEMAHSIEGRTPFLDHHLAEFSNSLPPSTKVHVDVKTGVLTEKWILREAGKPFVSKEMYERKKHPFTAPHQYSSGGPMHALLSRLVTSNNLRQLGFIDLDEGCSIVHRAFVEHDAGAMRAAIVLAQWVVLSKEFDIPAAMPETAPKSFQYANRLDTWPFCADVERTVLPPLLRIARRVLDGVRLMY